MQGLQHEAWPILTAKLRPGSRAGIQRVRRAVEGPSNFSRQVVAMRSAGTVFKLLLAATALGAVASSGAEAEAGLAPKDRKQIRRISKVRLDFECRRSDSRATVGPAALTPVPGLL